MWYQFLYHVITILLATPQSIVGISQNPGLTLVNICLYKSSNSFKEKINRTTLFMFDISWNLTFQWRCSRQFFVEKTHGCNGWWSWRHSKQEEVAIASSKSASLVLFVGMLCILAVPWPKDFLRAQGISRHLKAWPMPGFRNSVLFFLVCVCVCTWNIPTQFFMKKHIPTTWTPRCPIWIIHGLSQNWVRNTKQSSNHHLVPVDPSFPQVLWQVPTVKMVTGLPPYLGMMCRSRSWKPFLGDDQGGWLETRRKKPKHPAEIVLFLVWWGFIDVRELLGGGSHERGMGLIY